MPCLHKIFHKRGDTFAFNAQLTSSEDGTPIDLTGYDIHVAFADDAGTQVAHAELSADNGIALIDVTQGTWSCVFDSATTQTWPVGILHFDIRYISPDGTATTETAQVTVLQNVSA